MMDRRYIGVAILLNIPAYLFLATGNFFTKTGYVCNFDNSVILQSTAVLFGLCALSCLEDNRCFSFQHNKLSNVTQQHGTSMEFRLVLVSAVTMKQFIWKVRYFYALLSFCFLLPWRHYWKVELAFVKSSVLDWVELNCYHPRMR